MMSLPPIRFTTMSWEKTASPCGRPAPDCAVDWRSHSATLTGLLGLVMSRMSMSLSSRSSTSTTYQRPFSWLCHAKAECVWFAFVCGLPLVCAPEAFVKSPAPSTSFFGRAGLLTSTSEMPPTPFVVPGHHSFW